MHQAHGEGAGGETRTAGAGDEDAARPEQRIGEGVGLGRADLRQHGAEFGEDDVGEVYNGAFHLAEHTPDRGLLIRKAMQRGAQVEGQAVAAGDDPQLRFDMEGV